MFHRLRLRLNLNEADCVELDQVHNHKILYDNYFSTACCRICSHDKIVFLSLHHTFGDMKDFCDSVSTFPKWTRSFYENKTEHNSVGFVVVTGKVANSVRK